MTREKKFGESVENWQVPAFPDQTLMKGAYVALERLNAARHADEIHRANAVDHAIWDYLPYGPFESAGAYQAWVDNVASGTDPYFYAIRNLETGLFCGVLSYLRIAPESGSIEVGHVNFAPELQRTRAATEAFYLMMKWAFEAGYRRFEWKCDDNNAGSRRAAERLGLSYEGVFRQATVVKGRNRDTAWFAAIDKEWPALNTAFSTWLSPQNFDEDGKQKQSLRDLTAPIRVSSDPTL
ncbi:GNAT family N-acetyltransferase [Falsihalocynthiibacter sp. SS001]|uniref:GNAT family N-acetyltransferase n=1 Tax=Falsihalocynthiibacter sp. SS001 TaxID=3349698 RepID=UPI0036D27C8E